MTPNRNQEQKNWFYFIGFVLSRNSLEETVCDLNTFKPVEDPGEKPGSFAPPPPPLGRGEKKNNCDRPSPHPKVWIRHCKLWLKVSIYRETLNHLFLVDKPIFLSDQFFLKQQKQTLHDSWGHAPFSLKSLKKKYIKKNVKFLSYMLSDWNFKGIFKTSYFCLYYVWKDLSTDINLSILWIVPALMYDYCDVCT